MTTFTLLVIIHACYNFKMSSIMSYYFSQLLNTIISPADSCQSPSSARAQRLIHLSYLWCPAILLLCCYILDMCMCHCHFISLLVMTVQIHPRI